MGRPSTGSFSRTRALHFSTWAGSCLFSCELVQCLACFSIRVILRISILDVLVRNMKPIIACAQQQAAPLLRVANSLLSKDQGQRCWCDIFLGCPGNCSPFAWMPFLHNHYNKPVFFDYITLIQPDAWWAFELRCFGGCAGTCWQGNLVHGKLRPPQQQWLAVLVLSCRSLLPGVVQFIW